MNKEEFIVSPKKRDPFKEIPTQYDEFWLIKL